MAGERVIAVALEEEGVGPDNGKAHPDTDEVHGVRVGSVSLGGKNAGKALLGFLGHLGCESFC